jgi:hypothetical protein
MLVMTASIALTSACSKSPAAPSSTGSGDLTAGASIVVGVSGNQAATVAPGDRLQLWAVQKSTDGSSRDITNTAVWQSSDPSVATVSRDGVLNGAAAGAVDVTASAGRVSGLLRVTIQMPACGASTLTPVDLTFSAFGRFAQVNVTTPRTDCRWIAKSDADWLRLTGADRTSQDPGKSGSGVFSYNVQDNNFAQPRAGHITVVFTDGSQAVHSVSQEQPLSCSYVATPDDGYFSAAGGAGAFDVTTTPANCRWTATTTYGYYGVQVTSSPSGTGAGHVTYVVTPTFFSYAKEATIVIAGLSGQNPPGVHKIHITAQ